MAGYLITGARGAGKSLVAVARIRDYLAEGRPVATNLDLDLRALLKAKPASWCIRLPDMPCAADLKALPVVHDTGDEAQNGALVLDECAIWLNAREWGGGDRPAVINWLLQSRKVGWDLYFIVQDVSLLDKQARTTLFDYRVVCRRLDRLKVPFVGNALSSLTFGLWDGRFPQIHLGAVHYGFSPNAPRTELWTYRARELYKAYRTTQVLRPESDGAHCLLWREPLPPPRPGLLPKLPEVDRLSRLPREQAWRAAVALSRASA